MPSYLFSQRNGFTSVRDTFIRETVTLEIQNAILNCFDEFQSELSYNYGYVYREMEAYLWRYFLNEKMSNFESGYGRYKDSIRIVIDDSGNPWYKKLDIIEAALKYLYDEAAGSISFITIINNLVDSLNYDFERLNYAYRIVDKQIVEVTSKEEIAAIQTALSHSKDAVKEHLLRALELCSKRPKGDYRNSIKESISAVEVVCRRITEKNTLGDALNELRNKGVVIPQILKVAFEKLYAYTNNEGTGIRHGLMMDEGTYTPGYDEAVFMIVSCSAFINYLNKKTSVV